MRDLPIRDAGHGYDAFGLSARSLRWALTAGLPFYKYYFRVESSGIEHVPVDGPAILVGNHSGALPFDAMMIAEDVMLRTQRTLRPIVDNFVSALPFMGLVLQRLGAVAGAAANVRALLEAGERVLIFPEGVPGISKPRAQRYKLRTWRVGHAEMALRHHAPLIPVALIGAEEQLPILFNSRRVGRLFGLPHLPVPLVPFPFPVKYRIYYGPPVAHLPDQNPDDPRVAQEMAARTKAAVEGLIARGLAERRGVFS